MFNDFFQLVQDLLLTLQTKTVRFMKVIHFITDDKFLNSTIEMFEEIEELNNRYLIISDEETPFHFLTSTKVAKIKTSDINNVILDPTSTDVIVIHNLSSLPCEYIKEIHPKIKVVWFSWGFDTYANFYPQFKLIKLKNRIKPKTISFRYRLRMLNESRRRHIKQLKKNDKKGRNDFISAVHRVDFYSGVFPIEWELLKKNSFFRAKPITYHYPTKKGYFIEQNLYEQTKPKGDSILLGNSGTKLGNHGNSLWRISKLNLHDRKVIVPLSYGGDTLYKSLLCKKGKKILGSNFVPLMSFLPISEYTELIESVSIAIHNVEQQAAVGNIILNLWSGAKIFFPEKSMNYQYFKSLDFHVFSIEKDLNQKEIDSYLSEKDILDNRKKVIQHFSFDSIKEKVKNSFKSIEQHLQSPTLS